MSFDNALGFVLKWEGGNCDDPCDRGGRTSHGVTQREYDEYCANNSLPQRDVWEITPIEIHDVYFLNYWEKCKCGQMPEPVDLLVFDAAVQHGPARAIKFLQGAMGINADGVVGPITLGVLTKATDLGAKQTVVDNFLNDRRKFYQQIIARDPSQEKFATGWMNRLNALTEVVNGKA